MKLDIQMFARKPGILVIGTDLDSKKFEDKLAKLEAKYSQEQIDLEIKTSNLNKAKEEFNKLSKEAEKVQNEVKRINDELEPRKKQFNAIDTAINAGQAVKPSQYLAYDRLKREISGLEIDQEALTKEADDYANSLAKAQSNLQKAQAQYNKQLIKVQETNREMGEVKQKIESTKFNGIVGSVNKLGSSMTGLLKKVAKWSLAIIGIRSVYLGIRSAMNILTQYDTQLQANVDYLKWALANSIKPLIEWIIKAIYDILGLVGALVKAITGNNIFEKSGIKEYRKALAGANKSAKELKKTLAGFDEMNVLQDNSQGASAGGGGGLPNLGNIADSVNSMYDKITKKSQEFVDWWFKAGDDLKKALEDPEMFTKAFGNWDNFFEGIVQVTYGAWEVVTGIFESVGGLMDMIVGVFTGDWGKIKSGFKFFIDGILTMLSGLFDMAIGIIKIAFGFIKGILGDLWDGIKQICKAGWNFIKELFRSGWEFIKGLFVGVANWFNNTVIKPVGNFFSGLWTGIKNTASGAWNGIKSIFSGVATWFKDKVTTPIHDFFKNAIDKIKAMFTALWDKVVEIVNKIKGALSSIGDGIKGAASKVGDFFSNVGGKVKNFFGFQKGGIAYYKKGGIIPKLASGAIINQPGRGVPIGGAIGGERGAEGVLPLTDTQQMALLGEAIGKYVRIDNVIDVNMDSRKIKRILAESDNRNRMVGNGYVR